MLNNVQRKDGIIMSENKSPNKKWTSKRIVALIGVFLLLALYVAALFISIFIPDRSGDMLRFCIFGTVAIPFIIWVYIWMYGKLTGKHTIADFDYLQDTESTDSTEQQEN